MAWSAGETSLGARHAYSRRILTLKRVRSLETIRTFRKSVTVVLDGDRDLMAVGNGVMGVFFEGVIYWKGAQQNHADLNLAGHAEDGPEIARDEGDR